jgi:hypothetical protein
MPIINAATAANVHRIIFFAIVPPPAFPEEKSSLERFLADFFR